MISIKRLVLTAIMAIVGLNTAAAIFAGTESDQICDTRPSEFPACSDIGDWTCGALQSNGAACENCSSGNNLPDDMCVISKGDTCTYTDFINCGSSKEATCLNEIGYGWKCLLVGSWVSGGCNNYLEC